MLSHATSQRTRLERLGPAARARTVIASGHRVTLMTADRPDDLMPATVVEIAGVPHVLCQEHDGCPAPEPGTLAVVQLEGSPAHLGQVTVSGRFGGVRRPDDDPVLDLALSEHAGCLRDAADVHDPRVRATLTARPLVPAEVQVHFTAPHHAPDAAPAHGPRGTTGGGTGGGRRTRSATAVTTMMTVPMDEYRRAAPDLWLVHAVDIAAHLADHHQDQLLKVVRHEGVRTASAVQVHDLDAGGVVLTALSVEGVTDVVVPFSPPVVSVLEAESRVLRLCGGVDPHTR